MYNAEVLTSDWTTLEYIITPTGTSKYSNYAQVGPFLVADGIFVKSIKIEQGLEFLGTPVPMLPTDATGTSFTAKWKAVSGATKYMLNVYSYDNDGNKVMFITNQEVQPSSASAKEVSSVVTGLTDGVVYYYTVQAANESGVSQVSAEMEVVKVIASLDTPVVSLSTQDSGSFTASWNAVPNAAYYMVNVVRRNTMQEAGPATVLSENFNVFTTGTISNYDYVYARHLALLSQEGWTGADNSCINGAIGLTPYTTGMAYLATPALNLADDSGNVTVVLSAACIKAGAFTTGGSLKVALVDEAGNVGTPVAIDFDTAGFKTYTLTLQGGTATSKVKIYEDANNSNYRYFFDDIVVSQIKPAGFVNVSTYLSAETDKTEYTGSVEFAPFTTYHLTVTAAGRTVSGGAVAGITSAPSSEKEIGKSSGVDNVSAEAEVSVKALGNGAVAVSTDKAAQVTVYNMAGAVVAAAKAVPGVNVINVDGVKGLVIVKVAEKVSKVVL